MANISSSNSADVLILVTDTTLLHPTAGRAFVSVASLHEQTAAVETLELFISTDATSAAGERIDLLTFAASETKSPGSLIRGIPSGYYLIGKATNGSRVMASLTYTQYSGDA